MNTAIPRPFPHPLSVMVAGTTMTASSEDMSARCGGVGARALAAGTRQHVDPSLLVPLSVTSRPVAVSTERMSRVLHSGPLVPSVLARERTSHVPALATHRRPLVHVVALPSTSGCHGFTPVAATSQRACRLVAQDRLRLLGGGDSSVVGHPWMRVDAPQFVKGVVMTRPEPVLRLAVLALSDATQRARVQLMQDGILCDADSAVLAGMREAMRLVEQGDFGRRMGALISTTGDFTPYMLRQARELAREFDGDVDVQQAA